MRWAGERWRWWSAAVAAVACVGLAQASASLVPIGAVDGDEGLPAAPWVVETLPDQRLPVTAFRVVRIDGGQALRIEADASYGNLVQRLNRPAGPAGLSWRWRVDRLNRAADLRSRQADDTSAKVCVMFDLPIERVPFVERQLLRLARTRMGQPLPAATVCYVWDTLLPAGTRIDNAYSRRVRYLVLRSGAAPGRGWVAEQRNLAEDFHQLFGDESPRALPAITAVALGADADNTGGRSLAYVADLRLEP